MLSQNLAQLARVRKLIYLSLLHQVAEKRSCLRGERSISLAGCRRVKKYLL